MLSVFYLAVPFAVVFGSLISAPLLMMHGLGGLGGWQWLFIIEALPAVILGIYLFFRLKDKPEQATWLDDEEKAWLTVTLDNEKANLATPGQHRLGQVFADPRVIKMSLVYFGMNFAGIGLIMFLPQIVAGFGSALSWVGIIAAIPYFVASGGARVAAFAQNIQQERREKALGEHENSPHLAFYQVDITL
ncbi:MFS transporter [Sodalis glossinidius]|uniref:MFS transporter n=1 Tax=Sodalis glossinidius TaxID=63612 RepID=UPI0003225B2A|nr:MFS transporter [Sodalis glossinidius]